MEKEILDFQVLLEIALNQKISGDIEVSLTKIMNLYLIKLNCIAVAIYKNKSVESVVPTELKKNDVWMQKMTNFFAEMDVNNQEPVFKTQNQTNFYGFHLQDYEWLVLICKKEFSESLIIELNKVVNQLGKELYQVKEEQRYKLLQSIFDKSSDGIQIAEESGNLYYINEIASERLGIHPSDVSSYHVCDVEKNFLNDINAWQNHVNQLIAHKKIIFEGQHINQNSGKLIPVELTVSLIEVKNKNFIIASARYISKHLKQKEEIKETNQKLASVFNEMSDVVWSLKLPSLEVLLVTPSVKNVFEIEADVVMKDISWWKKVIIKKDAHVVNEIKRSVIKNGNFIAKYRIETPSGEIKWLRNKGKLVYDSDLRPIRLDGVITDKTRQYLAQETLAQEVKLQEVLIDIASSYINLNPKDVENTIHQSLEKMGLFVSSDRAYIFDYDFVNETTTNTYEWCREGIEPKIQKLQNIPNVTFSQWIAQHQKGNAFYVKDVEEIEAEAMGGLKYNLASQGIKSLIAIPMLDGNDLLGFVGFDSIRKHYNYSKKEQRLLFLFAKMLVNIKNRQKWENQIRLQEEKYRNIIANIYQGILEVDLNDKIIFANQTFCEMSGYKLDELKGKFAAELLVAEKQKNIIFEKIRKRIEKKSDSYEIKIINKNGQKKWWFISGAPNYNDKGQLIGSIGIHLDITEQKRRELELAKSKTFAEAAAKAKELFLTNMSHEIRTPLNIIIGMIRLLTKEKLSSSQHFYVKQSESSAKHLLNILNSILDIAKIKSGDMEIIYSSFSPSDLAYNVHSIMYSQAAEKNLPFLLYVDPEIKPVLIGDETRLRQVLINLIGNAVKFTDKGTIKLSVYLVENLEDKQVLRFDIEDTGIGMSEAFISKLYDKFSQENSASNRNHEGTGLGMAISRDLIKLMGGDLKVISEKFKGTNFIFDLELKTSSMNTLVNTHNQVEQGIFEGKKVLVVEDNEINRFITIQSLDYLGFQVTEAENGWIAINKIQKEDFDLILMDIQMPIMNGIQATTFIRENLNVSTPIIALSAHAFKHDIELYLQKGMNDFITKPFDENDFFRKIELVMELSLPLQTENDLPLYNLSTVEKISRGNNDFVIKLLTIFTDVANNSVIEMQECIKNNDWKSMKAIAHKIKPSINQLDMVTLKEFIHWLDLYEGDINDYKLWIEYATTTIDILKEISMQFQNKLNSN